MQNQVIRDRFYQFGYLFRREGFSPGDADQGLVQLLFPPQDDETVRPVRVFFPLFRLHTKQVPGTLPGQPQVVIMSGFPRQLQRRQGRMVSGFTASFRIASGRWVRSRG